MQAGGESADQVVRMSLQGIEVATNVAMKIGGTATKSLAATLYAIMTDKKKIKGKARLDSMLKSGKELKVFAIHHDDLKMFCEEAKRYGVLYSVLKEKNNKDGICDIMVRAEDASKISRIVDKFELATIDTKAIREAVLAKQNNEELPLDKVNVLNEKEHDDLVKSIMKSLKDEKEKVPKSTRTKADANPFEPISKTSKSNNDSDVKERPSIREEIKQIKEERKNKNEMNLPKTLVSNKKKTKSKRR